MVGEQAAGRVAVSDPALELGRPLTLRYPQRAMALGAGEDRGCAEGVHVGLDAEMTENLLVEASVGRGWAIGDTIVHVPCDPFRQLADRSHAVDLHLIDGVLRHAGHRRRPWILDE